jgi:hypothetical protein
MATTYSFSCQRSTVFPVILRFPVIPHFLVIPYFLVNPAKAGIQVRLSFGWIPATNWQVPFDGGPHDIGIDGFLNIK